VSDSVTRSLFATIWLLGAATLAWSAPTQQSASETRGGDESAGNGVTVATSGGRSPEWTNRRYQPEDLWAYRPIRRSPPPHAPVGARFEFRNPIDLFIAAKLADHGIDRFAPPADPPTLMRRAAFDLHGLPPSRDDVLLFTSDDSPDAYERLVDRLLASPHYGEQQARHWLDVVRYADTSGFSNDYERPNAWRYRDYVIRSFNSDKPYDRFAIEQLAGDELNERDPELLVAAGFLRTGPWEHTGMTVAAVTRQQYLDDVTHNVGVAFLGQGLRCARCHDHKFDPVPTKDYYHVQAVFAATQLADREAPFVPSEHAGAFDQARGEVEARLQAVRELLDQLKQKNERAVAAFLKERGVAKLADLAETERTRADDFGLTDDELTVRKVYQKQREYYERELTRFEPYAFSVYNGAPNNYGSNKRINPMPRRRDGDPPIVRILAGGALESPTEAVMPGTLSAVAALAGNGSREPDIDEAVAGRRLAFARWVAHRDNPLTARVMVNRVWQQHFGKGLAATPNNLGKMGGRPTHPELLDWLAAWFVDNGWSLKKLHNLIMTSATYRQSGDHRDAERLAAIDAAGALLACFPPRRLAAEELRDAMLATSGELNRAMGGPGCFPEINWEVALQPRHVMGSVAPAYQPSRTPAERNRRTIYAFRYRTLADPILEVFNRPASEISCERRDQTTVTPQALAQFNSEFSAARALAWAISLRRHSRQTDDAIDLAFERALGRPPSTEERAECQAHVARMIEHHRAHSPKPTDLPVAVRRHMVEELTGRTVHWDEELVGMKAYDRDVQAWEVDPTTRALAELCLVLFNCNEFMYVR
jgi:hypothetical protein